MYIQIDKLAVDKAVNTIPEEGIAPAFIREFYRRKGLKVLKVEKHMADIQGSRKYDLYDNLGGTWEITTDHKWWMTGNIYLEIQAFQASEAEFYLIFAGKAYVARKTALREAIRGRDDLTEGGDLGRSLGFKLSLQELETISEEVLIF